MSTRSQSLTKDTAIHSFSFIPVTAGILQRKCACGQHTIAGGECEDCSKKREGTMQRASVSPAPVNAVPPIVHDVLSSSGQPLDAGTRAFVEPRFGHDFSRVRVHTDARAAESARVVNALAYTVGRDVVFGEGQYAPGTSEGRRLLAHELTHVVQQCVAFNKTTPESNLARSSLLEIGAEDNPLEQEAKAVARTIGGSADLHLRSQIDTPVVQRALLNEGQAHQPSSPRNRGSTLPYREATELLECIRIMGDNNADYCRQAVLGEKPEHPVQPQPQPQPSHCVPDRSLTWADFNGTPSGSRSAWTSYNYSIVTSQGQSIIRATLDPSTSWVKPQFGNPSDRSVNGCARNIHDCESFFKQAGSAGGTWALDSRPSRTCPASIRSDPSVVAASRADCTSVIGPECDRVAQLESSRVLRHEQFHLDLACALVRKANTVLSITPSIQPQAMFTAVQAKDTEQRSLYDTQTNHGCNPASQSQWETIIQNGLPSMTLP